MELWTIEPNGEEIEVLCGRITDYETFRHEYVDVIYYEDNKDIKFVTAVYSGTDVTAEIMESEWQIVRKKAILAILADAA